MPNTNKLINSSLSTANPHVSHNFHMKAKICRIPTTTPNAHSTLCSAAVGTTHKCIYKTNSTGINSRLPNKKTSIIKIIIKSQMLIMNHSKTSQSINEINVFTSII